MALVYHYCLHKLHLLPHVFNSLPEWERAFICASISEEIRRKKEAAEEMKRKSRIRRR